MANNYIMVDKIYPNLEPTAPMIESPSQFHIDATQRYYSELADMKKKYKQKLEKYLKKSSKLSSAIHGANAASMGLGIGSATTSFTVVGLPIGASLAAASTLTGGASAITSLYYKKNNKKITKTMEIVDSISTEIGKFELLISKSLTNGFTIDDQEFQKIQEMYNKIVDDIKTKDRKMSNAIDDNFQKTMMQTMQEEIKNLKNQIEKKPN